jgi:hypothetical protein
MSSRVYVTGKLEVIGGALALYDGEEYFYVGFAEDVRTLISDLQLILPALDELCAQCKGTGMAAQHQAKVYEEVSGCLRGGGAPGRRGTGRKPHLLRAAGGN